MDSEKVMVTGWVGYDIIPGVVHDGAREDRGAQIAYAFRVNPSSVHVVVRHMSETSTFDLVNDDCVEILQWIRERSRKQINVGGM